MALTAKKHWRKKKHALIAGTQSVKFVFVRAPIISAILVFASDGFRVQEMSDRCRYPFLHPPLAGMERKIASDDKAVISLSSKKQNSLKILR